MSGSTLGVAAALGSTVSWALCGVCFKRLGERLDPVGMTVAKSLVAAVLLIGVVFVTGSWLVPTMHNMLLIVASGIIGVAIGDSLFFAALGRLSPLLLATLLLAGPDIFSGVLGILCLGEMPSWQVWCAIAALMLAMGMLMLPEESKGSGHSTRRGVLFGLGALACTAIGSVVAKPALVGSDAIPSLEATAMRMFGGGLALAVCGTLTGKARSWIAVFRDIRYAAGFVAVTALVAFGGFWLSLVAIKSLEIVTAGALMSLEPLFVLPIMILFFKHRTCLREIVAMTLAVAGIVVIVIYSNGQ